MASSDLWFAECNDLITVLESSELQTAPGSPYQPVSVAIIDTGIKPESKASHCVVDYEDFVIPGNKTRVDETGHGTYGAELLVKVFPGIKLFVARVWRTNSEDSNTKSLMAAVSVRCTKYLFRWLNVRQAIHHAHQSWGVDIISIASGFHESDDAIHNAIMKAASDRVLIFAAASNYGNLHNITFPARMKHQVFGIFATDARANIASAAASINPQPDPDSRNFATLGEEITVQPFTDPVFGTSYSTAIAAGIAGQLLDFSRQPECQRRISQWRKLRSIEGMTAVLSLMTLGKGNHGYSCLRPRRLIENYNGADREEMRRRLCNKISDTLESL